MNALSISPTRPAGRGFSRSVGAVVAVVGGVVLAAWLCDFPLLLGLIPGGQTMKANAALNFILSGGALFLLTLRAAWARHAARGCVLVVGGIALLTLAEYAAGASLGLDEFLVRAPVADAPPGRMAPNSALGFLLTATALWLMSQVPGKPRRPLILGWLGAGGFGIGLFALLGYAAEFGLGYRWWGLPGMAVHAAALFVLLSAAVLRFAWQDAGKRWMIGPWQTAGLAGGLLLLVGVAIFSQRSARQLVDGAAEVQRAHAVIGKLWEVGIDLEQQQSGVRGFLLTGDEALLALYQAAVPEARQDERALRALLAGNAAQLRRLVVVESQIAEREEFWREIIELRRKSGPAAAVEEVATRQGKALSDELRLRLGEMVAREERQLAARQMQAQATTARAFVLLPAGVLLSLILLSVGVLRLNGEATERQRGTELLAWEKGALELIGGTASLHPVLDELMVGLERQSPGALCSVLLLDEEGGRLRHGAAPSLPEEYNRLIDGVAIGPAVGSCGTAAFSNRQVIVADLARDPLWADYRDLALGHGLRACWSTPIHCSAGKVLGTFAIYYREPRHPTPAELELIVRAVHVTRIAIERKRADEKIHALTAELEQRVAARTAELQAANASLTDFKAALDAHAIVSITDPQGKITYANDNFCAISQYARAELLGQDHGIVNSGHHPPTFMGDLWQAITSGRVWKGEIKNRAKNGSFYWVNSTIVPFLGAGGKPVQFIAIRTDITRRKKVEEALRDSEERMRLAAEAADTGVWEWDVRTDALQWDERMFAIYGLPPAPAGRATYADWRAAVLPADLAEQEAVLQQTVATCGRSHREFRIVRAGDRAVRVIHGAEMVVPGADGKAARVVGINLDITARKRAEEQIVKLNEALQSRAAELEAANRELEGFSYSVSHDLRAPLRAVDGYSRMLVEDCGPQLDDEGRRMLGVIRSETRRMGRLIDDLLAFARLGRQQIEPTLIDMHALAREVFDELAALEPERQLRLELRPLPPARGTAAMLRQVWVNVIGNAIKFTSERAVGEIEIGAREDAAGGTQYYVKDNGAGFDMRYVGKLFGVFQRLHTKQEFDGTGVGLALVQRIVQRHGGRVAAEGEVDRGATFSFTLPTPIP